MAKTMTASMEITDGQIDNLANKLRDATRKQRSSVPRETFQQVLGVDNLGMRLFVLVQEIAATMTGVIRRVKNIDRALTPTQVFVATGRKCFLTEGAVDTLPHGKGEEAEVIYFRPHPSSYIDGRLSCEQLEREYDYRGLEPDPRAQAKDNQDDSSFADSMNACQWRGEDGHYYHATFDTFFDGWGGRQPRVFVDSSPGQCWKSGWSFGGVRKKSSASTL